MATTRLSGANCPAKLLEENIMRVLSTLAAIAVTAMVVPAVAQETLKIGGIALFAVAAQPGNMSGFVS